MFRKEWYLLLVLVAFVGCGKKSADEKNFTVVDSDDPKMKAAIEKARSTVGTFTTALKSPKTGQSAFSVKLEIDDGSSKEHMWLNEVTFDGMKFRGKINNEPQMVKNVKLGDRKVIEATKISDWMYIQNRKLVGGYTLRVLRDAMPDSERAEFDKSMPFTIE